MKKNVYCVGLMCCDIPLRPVSKDSFDRDHCTIDIPVWSPGGDAVNAAIALSRLGLASSLTGLVGNDHYGDFIIDYLKKADVDISGVKRHPVYGTSTSHILIEPEGERHFLVCSPINGELGIEHINSDLFSKADLVYIGSSMCLKGLDNGGSAELFKKARSAGKFTASDFGGEDEDRGDYWLKFFEPMLKETDILLPSYREAVILTGKRELPEIREALSLYGIKILAVKLGNKGSYITDFKNEWKVPAFDEFKPVDTTGAGDSFASAFITAFLYGWDCEASGIFANAVAGFNVSKTGATGGVPDFKTALDFVTERFGKEKFPMM